MRSYSFIRRDVVSRTQLGHQLVCDFIIGGYAFLLNLLAHLHGEMSQAFSILVPSSAASVGEKNGHLADLPIDSFILIFMSCDMFPELETSVFKIAK